MDSGGAIVLPVTMIAQAHILHSPVSAPVPDHRNERVPALPAGQKSGVAVFGLVPVGGAGLLL